MGITNVCSLQVLLAYRLDNMNQLPWVNIFIPLYISLLALIWSSFGSKGGNKCKYVLEIFSFNSFICQDKLLLSQLYWMSNRREFLVAGVFLKYKPWSIIPKSFFLRINAHECIDRIWLDNKMTSSICIHTRQARVQCEQLFCSVKNYYKDDSMVLLYIFDFVFVYF